MTCLRTTRSTKERYGWAKLNVENHLRPYFKYYKASKVQTKLVESYILQKRAENFSDATINRHLALLRRAFKLGAKYKPPKVTIASIPAFSKLDESAGVRQGFLEYTITSSFAMSYRKRFGRSWCTRITRVAAAVRSSACSGGQVDLGAGMVRLRASETKGKKARTIPLTDEARESLTQLKTDHDRLWPESPWVFTRAGKQIKDFRRTWADVCKRAGVGAALLHDMGRSGVRNLVRAGVSEGIAMKISGHRTRSVFDRYDITSEQDLGDAAKKLQLHLEKKVVNGGRRET